MSNERAPWQKGKCRVPMWMGGAPAGFCGEEAFGDQLPKEILRAQGKIIADERPAYCHGACCPSHGGPSADEPRLFMDGYTEKGRPMWCAVAHDFENLQESSAGFDGNPIVALSKLRIALQEQTHVK